MGSGRRPGQRALVTQADREGKDLPHFSLGGGRHVQPSHPVAGTDTNPSLPPDRRTFGPEPARRSLDQVQFQGVKAGHRGSLDGHRRYGDRLPWGHGLGQVGPLSLDDATTGTHPAVAHPHRVAARMGPRFAAIVTDSDAEPGSGSTLENGRGVHIQPGDQVLRLALGQYDPVLVLHRISEVVLHLGFVLDGPTNLLGVIGIADDPAEQDKRLDGLVVPVLTPVVDLLIGIAHPARVCIAPGAVLVGLGDIDRPVAQSIWDGRHEVTIGAKVPVIVLKGSIHLGVAKDQAGVLSMRVGMDGDGIRVLADQVQHVGKVLDPIAPIVAGIGRLGIPGTHGAGDDLVASMTRPAADFVPAFFEAGSIELGSDHLAIGAAGALPGQVHLVADDPPVAARAGLHKVAAAPGKVIVLGRIGDGAPRAIPIVQADDDAQALVGQVGVVAAAVVVGIRAQSLCDEHPATLATLQHQVLTTPIVHTKDVGRIAVGHPVPPLPEKLDSLPATQLYPEMHGEARRFSVGRRYGILAPWVHQVKHRPRGPADSKEANGAALS